MGERAQGFGPSPLPYKQSGLKTTLGVVGWTREGGVRLWIWSLAILPVAQPVAVSAEEHALVKFYLNFFPGPAFDLVAGKVLV